MEHYALPVQVYGVGLVFARVGAFMVLIPGVGESNVPPNIRLAFALLLSLVLYPLLRASLPAIPGDVGGIGAQIGLEVIVGLGLGALMRMFLSALAVAGEVVSLQTTLSFSQTTNPLQAQPSTTVSTFLAILAITLVFATDLHQLFIAAIAHSYVIFAPGRGVPLRDVGMLEVRTFAETFALGVQLAAPVLAFSLVFNIGTGLIGRAMPQFQVFFVATPLSLLLGLSVFGLGLGVFGMVWLDRFHAFVARFAGPGA